MDRKWIIDGAPIAVDDSEQLADAIAEAASILSRVGGAVVMVAQREQVAEDLWQPVSYVFKWSSYAPAKRLEPDAEPEPPIASAVAA